MPRCLFWSLPSSSSPSHTTGVLGVTPGCMSLSESLAMGALGASPCSASPPPSLSKFPLPLLPPAFHDDFFVPFEASTPALLIHKLTAAADLVASIAEQHAMKLQLAAGNTEAVIQLRGKGKKAALAYLAAHKTCCNNNCIAALPLASGDLLRVVTCYTHVGTISVASDNSAQYLAHRRASAQTAEKSQAARIICSENVP